MQHLLIFIKGMLIGIANVIPGVSGGTFALVLGLYDRLISALKSFDLHTIKVLLSAVFSLHKPASRQALRDEIKRTDLVFLMVLGIGAVISIKGLAGVLQWLLSDHPIPTLAFFVGLIIPSILVPLRMIDRKGPFALLSCAAGIALTVFVSMGQISTSNGAPSLPFVFIGGAVAIAAMILPGISGSFVLLLLGLYQPTLEHIHHITSASFVFLGVMAAGFLFGVVTISRLMAYLLARQRSLTLAFLIGLILGSFYVLWPFKDYPVIASAPVTAPAVTGTSAAETAKTNAGEQKISIQIATAPNRLPNSAQEVVFPGIMMLLGLGGAIGMNKLGGNRET